MPDYRTPQDLAELADYARPMGNGFIASCPLHDDTSPSLKISEGEKATVLWCHAGCVTTDILDVWSIGQEELFHNYDPKGSSGKNDLRLELKALKRELDPPPPLPETLAGLMSEAFSLPQPWHDRGLDAVMDTDEAGTPPHIALRRRTITRDVDVRAYFEPWCMDKGMDGYKLMEYAEWGMQRLTDHWRDRKAQL
jgi:hypothetical protein